MIRGYGNGGKAPAVKRRLRSEPFFPLCTGPIASIPCWPLYRSSPVRGGTGLARHGSARGIAARRVPVGRHSTLFLPPDQLLPSLVFLGASRRTPSAPPMAEKRMIPAEVVAAFISV